MANIPVRKLIDRFQLMLREHWSYTMGASDDGNVDCAGAFVNAYRHNGKTIYHGSNRIARKYVDWLIPINEAILMPSMAAFKARDENDPNYALPDSYKPGGACFNGDLNDYYHIGLVDDDTDYVLNAQGTATGFVRSPITQNWDFVAYLNDVDYDDEPQPTPIPTQTGKYKVVGGNLRLRKGPGKNYDVLLSIPDGTIVDVVDFADAGQWAKLTYRGTTGYCMATFIEKVDDEGGDQPVGGDVTIPRQVWEELQAAFEKAMNAIK